MDYQNLSAMKYDLAILGGGPAGYTAGERAGENGLKAVLFEKKTVGGVCLNEGCIPTKTLLYSAKILETMRKASRYGIRSEGKPEAVLPQIIERKNRIVQRLVGGVKMKLSAAGVTVVAGEAMLDGEENGHIRIRCNGETYQAKYVLLCTGSETVIPPIEGLDRTEYWTSREALEATELPESLAVIGGGVIGMEFASFFNALGVRVKVIEMMPEILGATDKEIAALLRADCKKKGIEFYLGTKVTSVDGRTVRGEKDGKPLSVEADKLLVSIGRRAVWKGLGLESLGIGTNRSGVTVNDCMQTSHPRVYACGDITGYSLLAHTAYREAAVAVSHLAGEDVKMDYRAIPSVVYTDPELASVGLTEEELRATGAPYTVRKIPMTYSGRYVVENESFNGLCKLLIDPDERVVGCHLAGTPASEFIIAAGMAVARGYTAEAFGSFVFPHPTVSEILYECVHS